MSIELAAQAEQSLADLAERFEQWRRTRANAYEPIPKDMVAKIGRASRLGERSRGVLDAGATSCYLILNQLGRSVESHLTTTNGKE